VFKKSSRIALATALGASVLVAGSAAVPAQAKTVKACVNKSTGELRILTGKKKCKKGWKKISWNKKGATGPQGNPGAQGPNLSVKDSTGKVLGKFLGVFPQGLTLLSVEIDGGAYTYLPNGLLFTSFMSDSPRYKTNDCTGTAYLTSSSAITTQFLTGSAGGPSRVAYRKTDPTYGPPQAWEFTSTSENAVALQLYRRDKTFTCLPEAAVYNGTLVVLSPVPAPPDVPGPLTIG
jgi:hypothetical protein